MPTIEEVQADNRALKDRVSELLEEADVIRGSFAVMAQELKEHRVMNGRLRHERNNCPGCALLENQLKNAQDIIRNKS